MRQVIDGHGNDSTASVRAYLLAGNKFTFAHLYLIGYPDDPNALWLTDWESPIYWPVWGNQIYQPSAIKRSSLNMKFGFEPQSLQITWTPAATAFNQNVSLANPYQKAIAGLYDNIPVRVWDAFLIGRGDCMTYGCAARFGGKIGDTKLKRGEIAWSVSSFLDVVNQQVPTNVIELFNTGAAYTGATPPAGFGTIPFFDVVAGDSTTQVIGNNTSGGGGSGHIYGDNVLRGGYLVFQAGPGATLDNRTFAAIQANTKVTIGGHDYNQLILYTPLPWPPTPVSGGLGDRFYVSAPAPVAQSDDPEAYVGFPYLPSSEMGIA